MEMNEDTRKAAMPPPPPPPSRTSVGKCQLRSKLFLIRLGKEAAEEEGRRESHHLLLPLLLQNRQRMVAKKLGLPKPQLQNLFRTLLMVLQSV